MSSEQTERQNGSPGAEPDAPSSANGRSNGAHGSSTDAPSTTSPPAEQRNGSVAAPPKPPTVEPDFDEFGLPIRKRPPRSRASSAASGPAGSDEGELEVIVDEETGRVVFRKRRRSQSQKKEEAAPARDRETQQETAQGNGTDASVRIPAEAGSTSAKASLTRERSRSARRKSATPSASSGDSDGFVSAASSRGSSVAPASRRSSAAPESLKPSASPTSERRSVEKHEVDDDTKSRRNSAEPTSKGSPNEEEQAEKESDALPDRKRRSRADTLAHIVEAGADAQPGGVSEWSHQALAPRPESMSTGPEKEEWQAMPALGKYDLYDDDGRLVARGADSDSDSEGGGAKGGAKKGYTRVQDDDARSATSMDENTSYLFKAGQTTAVLDDEEQRDAVQQMEATKDLLTEGQRIAYVGVTRLSLAEMVKSLERLETGQISTDETEKGEMSAKEAKKQKALGKDAKKVLAAAVEATKKWGQKMMVRLYAHMDIDSSEQLMIEQLAEHGVQPADLTPALMRNARVKNPMADLSSTATNASSTNSAHSRNSSTTELGDDAPPPYSVEPHEDLPEVRNPDQLPATRSIDLDLRWTVLCDLFLVLIADSVYDARSRVLLEHVAAAMDITWVDICRFEKRVTDALEMQEAAEREDWDEGEHIEHRRKLALRKRYMVMGLATVGGSLVIGLSAGLLAPVIGAGLAAGFTTVGVAGTSTFFGGVGGAALITGIGVTTGGTIGVRAGRKRMGPVRTFEYRPLHNNKRVNLIVTVSGWMTGVVDDVRLPFSTVDPIMGDIYSVLWEPDMLCSMGDTIRILATEALTQGLQHALAATILTTLMAGLALPIALTKLSYLLDNPWNVSLDRAESAGLILADSIIDRNLGVRPITLVGFSLGAKLIFSCLKELARRGAHGLVQNVYLFGAPVVARKEDYLRARAVVAGRFVNGYATNDWILGYLFRATSGGIGRVAGMASVDGVPGLENFDVTEHVPGHMVYREAMPRLLREVGWEVTSDDFAEIEDPDPDDHEARQRKLIREIDNARKEAENKKGRAFGLFKRTRMAAKKTWETYDVDKPRPPEKQAANGEEKGTANDRVLFDVEAIRRELANEHLEIKQLESTLPPMQLDLRPKASREGLSDSTNLRTSKTEPAGESPLAATRDIKSADAATFPSVRTETASDETNDDHPREQEALAPTTAAASSTDDPKSAPLPSFNDVRPVLRTAATMPLEQNAWANEEEELGEGEVVMSFE